MLLNSTTVLVLYSIVVAENSQRYQPNYPRFPSQYLKSGVAFDKSRHQWYPTRRQNTCPCFHSNYKLSLTAPARIYNFSHLEINTHNTSTHFNPSNSNPSSHDLKPLHFTLIYNSSRSPPPLPLYTHLYSTSEESQQGRYLYVSIASTLPQM